MSELKRAFDAAWLASEKRSWIPGRMGRPNGDGTYTLTVASRPSYVYVQVDSEGRQGVTIARNMGVPRLVNLPVKMREDHGVLSVFGVDETRIETFVGVGGGGSSGGFSTSVHTHAIGSGLEYEVESLRFEPGRVKWLTGMVVEVNGFRYHNGSTWDTFPGTIIDLTSYIPATTLKHGWVLIGINPLTNTSVVVAGSTQAYGVPLTSSQLDDISFSSYIPLMGIKIRNDDTDLSDIAKYQDARSWNTPPNNLTNSISIVASETLAAGDLVNIWNDSGTQKMRLAGSNLELKAHGFVLVATSSGSTGILYSDGLNTAQTGLTPGDKLFLGDSGAVTTTPPTTKLFQEVGVAISTTSMQFRVHQTIML